MKKVEMMSEQLLEDLEFAKRTEAALKRIDECKDISMDFNDFIEEMNKW